MELNREKVAAIRKELVEKAQAMGKTIEALAADQIADMRTQAKDSIIRAAVIGFILGAIVATVMAVLVK
jgi:hypothetical protein